MTNYIQATCLACCVSIRFGSTLLQHTGDNTQDRILRQPITTQHYYSNFDHFHQLLLISAYIHHHPWLIFYYTCCRPDNNRSTAGRAGNQVTKQVKRRYKNPGKMGGTLAVDMLVDV